MRPLRLVPDGTAIPFMRGRFAGVITSAVLSVMSAVLFFYPGLNFGVDFRGGVVVELRGLQALPAATIREAFAPLGFGDLRVQEFGSPRDVIVRFDNKTQLQDAQRMITARAAEALPNVEIRRIEVVGARVSGELFRSGLLATALAPLRVAVWGRRRRYSNSRCHEDGRVLCRDPDRIRPEFRGGVADADRLTDKVIVYDRIRENLGKYRTMPLRELIDRSINQTLGRTVATSLTVVLSILPLALIGGEVMRGFALAIIFAIIIGTSSSIFIASPLLLLLGENRLRRSSSPAPQQKGPITAQ